MFVYSPIPDPRSSQRTLPKGALRVQDDSVSLNDAQVPLGSVYNEEDELKDILVVHCFVQSSGVTQNPGPGSLSAA